jgi:hypothetical protein
MAIRCDAPKPFCVAPIASFTCGAPAFWDILVPETFLSTGAKPKQTISPTVMPVGMVWDDKNGAISGTAVEPNLCAWNNYTVTITDSGGTSTCSGAIRVMAEKPKIEYSASVLTFTHMTKITEVTAASGGSCAPIANCLRRRRSLLAWCSTRPPAPSLVPRPSLPARPRHT